MAPPDAARPWRQSGLIEPSRGFEYADRATEAEDGGPEGHAQCTTDPHCLAAQIDPTQAVEQHREAAEPQGRRAPSRGEACAVLRA
jgi:hypothetical protein